MATMLPSRNEIEHAISIVSESRRSHETWLAWYEHHPSEEAKHADTCGGAAWQRRCIAEYDHVLSVLARMKMANDLPP